MKSAREFFKNNAALLDESPVQDLLEYCEKLESELVEFKFQRDNNKELAMLDMLQEVIKGCNDMEQEQMEHERFGYEAPQYEESIAHLKQYILDRCREERIYL